MINFAVAYPGAAFPANTRSVVSRVLRVQHDLQIPVHDVHHIQ